MFRVLIVQDPLSRVLSAYGDDLLAKTGAKLTAWDDSKRAGFSEVKIKLENSFCVQVKAGESRLKQVLEFERETVEMNTL